MPVLCETVIDMAWEAAWHDDALTSCAQDALGTKHVARRAAKLIIETYSRESSTVVGLTGPWGSGKSSIVSMCCEILREEHSDWAVATFTPWATGDSAAMMAEFYATLIGALPVDRAQLFREKVGALAQAGTAALKLLPVAGDVTSELAGQAIGKLIERPSWDRAFQDAADRLKELKLPILIVVDDVDRLQHDELGHLLKVVRLLGRFPGVSYVLAYDEQTLLANIARGNLAGGTRSSARLFMEKIVQYPFTVPPLLPSQILERVGTGVEGILAQLGREMRAGDSRLSLLADVFQSQLTTPRAVNRYLAQVYLTLSMHEVGEIDDCDVVMLTLVRVQFPELYAALPRWRTELTGGKREKDWVENGDKPVDFSGLFETVPEGSDRWDARETLAQLFPSTSKFSFGSGAKQSVRNADYFNRYFVNAVPADDIRDADVRAALQQAATPGDGADLLEGLLTAGSSERNGLALRRMWAVSVEDGAQLDSIALLSSLMGMWEKVPDSSQMLFNHRDMLTRWAAEVLQQVPGRTRADDLETALELCAVRDGRLHVLWFAGRRREALAEPLATVASREAGRLVLLVLENLRKGDSADESEPTLFWLMFIAEFGDLRSALKQIENVRDHGVSAEIIASRCVSIAHIIGTDGPGHLSDFDQRTFARFAPADDPFYELQAEPDVDQKDLSWRNRRLYVRGRATRPATLQLPDQDSKETGERSDG